MSYIVSSLLQYGYFILEMCFQGKNCLYVHVLPYLYIFVIMTQTIIRHPTPPNPHRIRHPTSPIEILKVSSDTPPPHTQSTHTRSHPTPHPPTKKTTTNLDVRKQFKDMIYVHITNANQNYRHISRDWTNDILSSNLILEIFSRREAPA